VVVMIVTVMVMMTFLSTFLSLFVAVYRCSAKQKVTESQSVYPREYINKSAEMARVTAHNGRKNAKEILGQQKRPRIVNAGQT